MQLEQLLAKQGKKGLYNGGTFKSDIDTFLIALELRMMVLLICVGCYSFCIIRIPKKCFYLCVSNCYFLRAETSDTYRTLSEENLKLQAEVMQYKVM